MGRLLKHHWLKQILSILKASASALENFALLQSKVYTYWNTWTAIIHYTNSQKKISVTYPQAKRQSKKFGLWCCASSQTRESIRKQEAAMNFIGIYCKQLSKEAQINIEEIAVSSIPNDPISDSEKKYGWFFYIRTGHVVYFCCF